MGHDGGALHDQSGDILQGKKTSRRSKHSHVPVSLNHVLQFSSSAQYTTHHSGDQLVESGAELTQEGNGHCFVCILQCPSGAQMCPDAPHYRVSNYIAFL